MRSEGGHAFASFFRKEARRRFLSEDDSENRQCQEPLALAAYLLRRLLLIIPTLFGIIAINFVVVQLAPGGPVEEEIAQLKGHGGSMGLGGGGPARRRRPRPDSIAESRASTPI